MDTLRGNRWRLKKEQIEEKEESWVWNIRLHVIRSHVSASCVTRMLDQINKCASLAVMEISWQHWNAFPKEHDIKKYKYICYSGTERITIRDIKANTVTLWFLRIVNTHSVPCRTNGVFIRFESRYFSSWQQHTHLCKINKHVIKYHHVLESLS
jgi:hypothetical protein